MPLTAGVSAGPGPGDGTIWFVEGWGRGELLAELVLASALKRRGHRVGFVARAQYEPTLRRLGLEFSEWGPGSGAARSGRLKSSSSRLGNWAAQGLTRWRKRGRDILLSMEWSFEFIRRQCERENALFITRCNMLGGRLAHEALGIPWICLHLSPAVLRSRYYEPGLPVPEGGGLPLRWVRAACWRGIDAVIDAQLKAGLNEFRSTLGLPPVSRPFDGWVYSSEANLCLFPEWYGLPQPDWPEGTVLTGFPVPREDDTDALPDDIARFLSNGPAPVVFTQGSHTVIAESMLQTEITACWRLGVRGVMAGVRAESFPAGLDDSLASCSFAPFNKLFPRAAAVVHHGGIGTTAQALWAGVPQVIVPLFDDQFYNAKRVEKLGAGVVLTRRRLDTLSLSRSLRRVLDSSAIRERCQELSTSMRRHDPMQRACEAVERYL